MTTDNWRLTPGYISKYGSDVNSTHILLGRFLADRKSEDPMVEKSLFSDDGKFEWGYAQPLEKVISTREDFEFLATHPQLFRNAITIIEPWEHVGINPQGEEVRASKNVAFMAQTIADCDSILFPAWSTGIIDLDLVVPILTSSMAVIIEGGNTSVDDPTQWTHPNCSRDDMFSLVEALLLSRTPCTSPLIMICLGHQLAAECHVRLLRQAVAEVLSMESLENDPTGDALPFIQDVCKKISAVGEDLPIIKRDGRVVAQGWNDPQFAVVRNEEKEIGDRYLLPYQTPSPKESKIPIDLLKAHDVMADEFSGVIDTMILQYENDINIAMFHSDEVNEEAVLFANWAYMMLHDALVPFRYLIANSPLSWLLRLPYSVEILASTEIKGGEILTECSCTCINYKDFETKQIRRSFTCQFHPELFSDLQEMGKRPPASYAELKESDGIRLLARLLYEGMQE
ncbi:MAG: hypothetical protein F6K40_30445 [Okeania sp. SIO3I5]|uniref:hypothetical protein n=1 Tax=Okeania sp. SIO3I5 TaxID=2607805 RepID=UPI0013BCF188|nr:hypothetical protein [Okeania sp. SIO3I5]NEQ40323.1 hypothetical protein [Okeania sp. SIO3I5]